MFVWPSDLAPSGIISTSDPGYAFWKDRCLFLSNIDTEKVKVFLDISNFSLIKIPKNVSTVVITMFGESPRISRLIALANQHPEVSFIWLIDIDLYDFKIPKNIYYFKYRFWYLHLEAFLANYDISKLIFAKNKKYKYKFSSFSFKLRQSRALVTTLLMNYAHNQSLISWHKEDQDNPIDRHEALIESLKTHYDFADLDWSVINKTILPDNFNWKKNTVLANTLDIDNAGYANTLINFTNETDSYGYYNDGKNEYIRPGPYLTEKTFKSLISGTIMISVGQPFIYNFLKNDYKLPLHYIMDLSYDNLKGDFDRLIGLRKLIETLSSTPLADIIDSNIDICEAIQHTLIDPDYILGLKKFNQQQDEKILETIEQTLK
jgi:hypothetical protein